jgi:hypothetical protein
MSREINSLKYKSDAELDDILAELQLRQRAITSLYNYVIDEKQRRFIANNDLDEIKKAYCSSKITTI